MRGLLAVVLLACTVLLAQSHVIAQKKDATRIEKKAESKATETKGKIDRTKARNETSAKSEKDPVVGKTKDGRAVYEGARGGFYYLTESGSKSYVSDFVGAKVIGETGTGLPIYEGPRGGRFYYSTSGEKIYVKK